MATRAEIEAYIRQAASARGLDPDFALAVAKGESSLNPAARLHTKREDSRGLWQLNIKGGLGTEAQRRGISLAPENWQQQTDFALDQARKSWKPWTVARNLMAQGTKPGAPQPPRRPTELTAAGQPMEQATPTLPGNVVSGLLANTSDPWKQIEKERQAAAQAAAMQQQATAQERQQAATVAALAPQPAAPPQQPVAPAVPTPPAEYAALLMPRIRRGLLANDFELGLLGVP